MIQRLRGRESFTRLRREGTRVRSGPLWCVMLADSSLESAHVGFAIGRTAGPAVERNRVRRRLREILRGVDLSPGLYLFGLTTSARELSFNDVRHAVQGIMNRVSSTPSPGS